MDEETTRKERRKKALRKVAVGADFRVGHLATNFKRSWDKELHGRVKIGMVHYKVTERKDEDRCCWCWEPGHHAAGQNETL